MSGRGNVDSTMTSEPPQLATQVAAAAANRRSFEETVTALAAHADLYASRLTDMSDDDMRGEIAGIDGSPTTRGAFLVQQVLGQCAAYRTQLFLYLKACGREELGTSNLWQGVDMPVTV